VPLWRCGWSLSCIMLAWSEIVVAVLCSLVRLHSAALAVVRCPDGCVGVCRVRALCQNGEIYDRSCYRMRIGNHTQAFEWYHFQWPWPLSYISRTGTVARPLRQLSFLFSTAAEMDGNYWCRIWDGLCMMLLTGWLSEKSGSSGKDLVFMEQG